MLVVKFIFVGVKAMNIGGVKFADHFWRAPEDIEGGHRTDEALEGIFIRIEDAPVKDAGRANIRRRLGRYHKLHAE